MNVTIEHKSDGCCGQEQIVLCKATETTNIEVFVGDELLVSYTYQQRGRVIDEDGVSVRVTNATKAAGFLVNFDIEIVFRTLSEEVSITCDVNIFSVTKNITTNSKFYYLKMLSCLYLSLFYYRFQLPQYRTSYNFIFICFNNGK